jgi:glucose/arabinose dehydrogenase
MKFTPPLCAVYALAVLVPFAAIACGGDDEEAEEIPFGLTTETVAPADHASDIVFAPDGRIFFAEQFTGNIKIIGVDWEVQEEPFAHVDVANWLDLDWGLTGLALDPQFQTNHFVYAFYTKPVPLPAEGTQETPSPAPETSTASPTAAPETTAAGGPPAIQTPPGAAPGPTDAPATAPPPGQVEPNPLGQPVLVRFTDNDGTGEEMTVISDNFPVTEQRHAGYNANGNIHFGPDGMLYVSVGDYDYATEPVAQDLSSPVGKLLRIDPATGNAPQDNPLVGEQGADARIFAYGFREPFDFVFQPETEVILGTDNTPYTCEELNVIRAGQNYGWPNVGEFPFAQCGAGEQVTGIHYFAREGMQPGDFVSLVEITGLAFITGAQYPALGDSLFVCEGQRSEVDGPGVLRRLVLSGDFTSIASDDLIVRDCIGDVETAPDGTLYYANRTEIRRLLPGATAGASGTDAVPSR